MGKIELTQTQKDLMNHTVSGPNRNWFSTSFGCKDSDEFEKLINVGFATKEIPPAWMGDDVIYKLTFDGRAMLRRQLISKEENIK